MTREEAIKNITELTYLLIDIEQKKKIYESIETLTALDDLPSVTPQLKWIPVSEKLPNFNDIVLASAYYDDKSTRPIIIKYNEEKFWLDGTIKAWMPLPEPYKENKEESE